MKVKINHTGSVLEDIPVYGLFIHEKQVYMRLPDEGKNGRPAVCLETRDITHLFHEFTPAQFVSSITVE